MKNNQSKVLVLDIETCPITAYVWNLKDQFIAPNQVVHDWYIMAWAAKWLGEPASKIIYRDIRHAHPADSDKEILAKLWELLDKADILITQNGKNFDSRKINARFIEHGMRRPSPYTHLDTYQILRQAASFSSNSLEFLTKKLCTKYKKLSHPKYPGMSLWVECLKNNQEAWNEMKKYNIHDVLSTEELYTKIRAWVPNNAPRVFVDPEKKNCSVCGHNPMQKRGIRYVGERPYMRLWCNECGHWERGKVK